MPARSRRTIALLALVVSSGTGVSGISVANAAAPIIAQNINGFEGLEEATVIYHPSTMTFENDPTNFPNMIDEGPMMIRTTLRNYQSTLGWWDGDRATTNTDRQRTEVKGIDGLAHQQQFQTYEYSLDFRTSPNFAATNHFCHIFQLKQTENGSSGSPLVTVSMYKNGSAIEGRIQLTSDGRSGTDIVRTFTVTPNNWNHVVVRITPTDGVSATGSVLGSINGDAFSGLSNALIYSLDGDPVTPAPSNDYRLKAGFYRSMGTSTDYSALGGDMWVEHRTVGAFIGSSHSLAWKGGAAANPTAWDVATTANFLNGAASTTFSDVDEVLFDDTTANRSVNLTANVSPGYVRINSANNYTFSGSFGITGGTLRKDGSGTLTLAMTNSYPGLTDVRAGTLLVTGSIGNNSLVSLTGGTLKAGSSAALGTNSTIGTQIAGGTLDINGFNLSTEPISVQGTGVSSAGAIVNTGAQQTSALTNVTLTGDTTLGGSGRWDIRGTGASLSTGGVACNLTKTGTNQISLVGAAIDAALANITVTQGTLAFQTGTTSMGDPTKPITVAAGATLGFFNTAATMTKVATLNGGRIWAESGTGAQNTFNGPIALGAGGGTVDANSGAVLNLTGNITGATLLTKNGLGTVTLGGSNTYIGVTNVTAGTLVMTNSFTTGSAVSVSTGAIAQLATSATTPNNVVLKTATLTTSGTGQLDLKDNKAIVTTTPIGSFNGTAYTGITGMIASGRNAGSWNGGGIITSMTDAAAGGEFTTIGVATAADAGRTGGTFGGVSVSAASNILLMYTYGGDANLDGKINIDDYVKIDDGIAGGLTGWSNGDFNYDGKVNIDDYTTVIDANILSQGAPFATASGLDGSAVSAVPEPGAAVLSAGYLALTLRRKRRGVK